MTPEIARLRASVASNARWAKEDRQIRSAKARASYFARFEKQVDPDRVLSPAERAERAHNAMQAHMSRMSLARAKAKARAS